MPARTRPAIRRTGKTTFAFAVTKRPQRGDERLLAGLLRVVDRAQERHLEPVDLVAEERQHREQQRVRDQHGRQHAERAADPELRDEVEADEGEAG